jgi:hypothetical protein
VAPVGTYTNLGVIGRNAATCCEPVSLHVSGFSRSTPSYRWFVDVGEEAQ